MTVHDVYDVETSSELLALQAPWWEPGTAGGYHAYTTGHLISEIVRRITGKPLGEFFDDEIPARSAPSTTLAPGRSTTRRSR